MNKSSQQGFLFVTLLIFISVFSTFIAAATELTLLQLKTLASQRLVHQLERLAEVSIATLANKIAAGEEEIGTFKAVTQLRNKPNKWWEQNAKIYPHPLFKMEYFTEALLQDPCAQIIDAKQPGVMFYGITWRVEDKKGAFQIIIRANYAIARQNASLCPSRAPIRPIHFGMQSWHKMD